MKYNRSRLCGNKSSKKLLVQMHVTHYAGNSKETTEFVNHGLLFWKQSRQKWLGRRKAMHQSRLFRVPKVRTLCLSMTKRFWLCRGNMSDNKFLESGKPFPKPIPLSEMVDFLVTIWAEEGKYD